MYLLKGLCAWCNGVIYLMERGWKVYGVDIWYILYFFSVLLEIFGLGNFTIFQNFEMLWKLQKNGNIFLL